MKRTTLEIVLEAFHKMLLFSGKVFLFLGIAGMVAITIFPVTEQQFINLNRHETEYIEADSTYDGTANKMTVPVSCKHVKIHFLSTSSANEAYLTYPSDKQPINPRSSPSGNQVRGDLIESGDILNIPLTLHSGDTMVFVSDTGTADMVVTFIY